MRALTLIGLLVLIGGCHRDRDHVSVGAANPVQFIWTGDLYQESSDETYLWTSTLNGVVRVEFKADDFEGQVRIRVYDGVGAEIYDETYSAESEVSFRESGFTAPSAAGTWQIRIGRFDTTGDLRVIVDAL